MAESGHFARHLTPVINALEVSRERLGLGFAIASSKYAMRNTVLRNDVLAALRAALIAERNRIEAANPTKLQVLAAPQYVAIEDQVPLLHEQFVALSRHSRERQTVALINAALDRFDRGEYGTCEDCDGEISMKRLQAVPWALRCIPCQERIERDSSGGNTSGAFAACG